VQIVRPEFLNFVCHSIRGSGALAKLLVRFQRYDRRDRRTGQSRHLVLNDFDRFDNSGFPAWRLQK
jgi:hypothetical protein